MRCDDKSKQQSSETKTQQGFTNRRYRDKSNQASMASCEIERTRGEEETVIQSFRKKKRRGDQETEFQPKSCKIRRRTEEDNDPSSRHIISNDVLEDIMVRLPVKSLVRFQVLSKHWMHTIKSTSFKERYLLRQKTQEPPALLCALDRNITLKTLSLDWSSSTNCVIEQGQAHHIQPQSNNGVHFSNSCDGLVYFLDQRNLSTPIIVTNPATRQSQALPLSRFQLQCQDDKDENKPLPAGFPFPGFGKDHVTGTYKLVWLLNNLRNKTLSCHVFDFELKEWRYVLDNAPFDLYAYNEPVFTNGWLYWRTLKRTILGYNLHTEMFRVITDDIISQGYSLEEIKMCGLSDRVWVTDMAGCNGVQDFWRVKDPLKSHWESEKIFSIDSTLLDPWFPEEFFLPFFSLVAASKDNKQVLISKYDNSNLVQLTLHQNSLVFHSVFWGPCNGAYTPYFHSLEFPF